MVMKGDKEHFSCSRPVLVGGCPSTGTTLLSVMLDSHPDICCGPELSVFTHPFFWNCTGSEWRTKLMKWTDPTVNEMDLPDWRVENGICPYMRVVDFPNLSWYGLDLEGFRKGISECNNARQMCAWLYQSVLEKEKKKIWAEKSPANIYAIREFLQVYPEGRAIIAVRDGRDVVCSLMTRGFSFGDAVSTWLVETSICEQLKSIERTHVIRYEDLVYKTEDVLSRLIEFLGVTSSVPSVDKMINYTSHSNRVENDSSIEVKSWNTSPRQKVSNKSIERWKKEMTREQLYILNSTRVDRDIFNFTGMIGKCWNDLLDAFGYNRIAFEKPLIFDVASYLWKENSVLCNIATPGSFCNSITRNFHSNFISYRMNTELLSIELDDFYNELARFHVDKSKLLAELNGREERIQFLEQQVSSIKAELDKRKGYAGGFKEILRTAKRRINGTEYPLNAE